MTAAPTTWGSEHQIKHRSKCAQGGVASFQRQTGVFELKEQVMKQTTSRHKHEQLVFEKQTLTFHSLFQRLPDNISRRSKLEAENSTHFRWILLSYFPTTVTEYRWALEYFNVSTRPLKDVCCCFRFSRPLKDPSPFMKTNDNKSKE